MRRTLALVSLLAIGAYMSYTPRGIRNHNPLNIRLSTDQWEGLQGAQTDPSFFQFTGPEWGIRAAARILLNYQSRYGLETIEQMISRWAPPTENLTSAYVIHIAAAVGIAKNEPVTVSRPEIMKPMLKAMIRHENGKQPYTDEQIEQGMMLAGIEARGGYLA